MDEQLRAAARSAFAALVTGDGDDFDLGRAAALVAAEERPGVDAAEVVGQLDELAAELYIPPDDDIVVKVARLNHHLFEEAGFRGDAREPDAPDNSLLHRVLERRRGLPILLSLVAMEVGRRVGVELDGIGFPGHFLVRPRGADPPFYIDPFGGGRILRQDLLAIELPEGMGPGVLRPVTARQLLVRLNRNLKHSYLRRRDPAGVLRACERLLVLDPSLAGERRDRALLLGQMGRLDVAIAELTAYLEGLPAGREADALRRHLARLIARRLKR
ncbi:MAG: hypothetical protein D6798_15625 [Deltaproteobacteria bacterium]|nr:MAG: hypothetical protein D6798_15625 [Deltaproteobacteria bacterium]